MRNMKPYACLLRKQIPLPSVDLAPQVCARQGWSPKTPVRRTSRSYPIAWLLFPAQTSSAQPLPSPRQTRLLHRPRRGRPSFPTSPRARNLLPAALASGGAGRRCGRFKMADRPGYDRFVKKYIDVKKPGIGGVAMMLTAYVVLSYMWSFDHIKHDRWRKYH
uniref:Uncharacterized protein n=1 Tax=Podarcis muralis TaxID=64176 RepID=A0A670KIC0_PODMU